jgi:HEAT repeat protein
MNKYNENQNISNMAYSIVEQEFSASEIFEILKGGNEGIKPIVILELKEIKTQKEFDLLIHHLTDHDGRIREAVASKLLELRPEFDINPDILIAALCDVNPKFAGVLLNFWKITRE